MKVWGRAKLPPVGNEILARARVDRRTKNLVRRLDRGEIAVINHEDLDRIAADGLVAARVSAVVNSKPTMSGRYPALGALVLIQAGIPVIDEIGEAVFNKIVAVSYTHLRAHET